MNIRRNRVLSFFLFMAPPPTPPPPPLPLLRQAKMQRWQQQGQEYIQSAGWVGESNNICIICMFLLHCARIPTSCPLSSFLPSCLLACVKFKVCCCCCCCCLFCYSFSLGLHFQALTVLLSLSYTGMAIATCGV